MKIKYVEIFTFGLHVATRLENSTTLGLCLCSVHWLVLYAYYLHSLDVQKSAYWLAVTVLSSSLHYRSFFFTALPYFCTRPKQTWNLWINAIIWFRRCCFSMFFFFFSRSLSLRLFTAWICFLYSGVISVLFFIV